MTISQQIREENKQKAKKLIKIEGSLKRVAIKLKRSPSTIWNWLNSRN